MHRIANAAMNGRDTVRAQRLLADPEPDWFVDSDEARQQRYRQT
jgi:hypothetical protein